MSDISYVLASSICLKPLTEYALVGDRIGPLLGAINNTVKHAHLKPRVWSWFSRSTGALVEFSFLNQIDRAKLFIFDVARLLMILTLF